jgi:hypothetical protein
MRLILPVLLLLLVNASAVAATIYKWVDANGVTHYSDQPYPGAKKIEVEAAQTYSAPAPAKAPASARAADAAPYGTCELFRPEPEEVLINVSSVTAKLRLDPALRAGDKATVTLDGRTLPDVALVGADFTIPEVYRGAHTVAAVVQNLAGQVVCQTDAVTFYVRQASELAPRSPQRAKPPVKPPAKPPAKPPGKP